MVEVRKKSVKNISKEECSVMNKWLTREFGNSISEDLKTKYPDKSKAFFVSVGGKIVSFGVLMPLSINYLGKKYRFLGIADIISVKKGKGYGKVLMGAIIDHLRKNKKMGIGFCHRKNSIFYKKSGLSIGKNAVKRFLYRKKNGEIVSNSYDSDIIYFFEDRSKFIEKFSSTKSKIYMSFPHW